MKFFSTSQDKDEERIFLSMECKKRVHFLFMKEQFSKTKLGKDFRHQGKDGRVTAYSPMCVVTNKG